MVGKKVEAIFVGPVPHKSFAAKKNSSMVAQVCINNAMTPVYICRNKSGVLKFTKSSIKQVIEEHEQRIKQENIDILEFQAFIKELFPHQRVF